MDSEIIIPVIAALSSFLTGIIVGVLKEIFKRNSHQVDISKKGDTLTVSLSADSDSIDVENKIEEYLNTQQGRGGNG